MNKIFLTALLIINLGLIFTSNAQLARTGVNEYTPSLDIDGEPINAHGGGALFFKGVYYLFGEIKKGKTWLVPGMNWEDYRVPAGGVSCYSSTDLKHWKNLGTVLKPTTNAPDYDLDTGRVIERPKVIYNEKTKKFVMWMHIDKNDYQYSRGGVAVSDVPWGPYRYLGSVKPNGQMLRDMNLFKDTDGKAYLIYSSEDNFTMHICLLSDDYLKPTQKYSRILIKRKRESPAVFEHKGKYFLITSACSGWSPNAASYAIADHILGPWSERGNPCKGKNADKTFFLQGGFVIPVNNKPGEFIFMGDRWNKMDLEKSDYLWLPIHLNGSKMRIYN
ncbi:Glycosyl hydrolases family 43 [Mucilaginibacter gossypiicola]|uniref:Glycosyl hydrolases family 43 n=1 Tax=Mucilaginibacter gossypiicola TaxID=551995 RepID=A0A1H8LQX8_9SPHI|nr:glycoside hydrolase family 43 protein [Mucilaginibacter gossypiicola]SEO07494.1 Glycosyl hydrolases family 43 [Mucilaginibacter gossypiicola]